ncbi:MAG: ATP phosphoribosyltransferase, partial [Bacteroidota bacterium]|nr:ATP phosphoribosyltransferase [Bacteroidota bacterium]
RSWGATEVLPPEDADCIVDNTATGSTLQANRLEIVDTLMTSSTRLYANPRVLDDPAARERIEALVLVLQSVLDARRRVMVELNVTQARLEKVLSILPAMRKPTLSQLQGDAGSAVRAAVPKAGLAKLIPSLRRAGATDIVVSRIDQIVA